MREYVVEMMDGVGIWYQFYVKAPDKQTAYEKVIDSFAVYGAPYGIEKDGCRWCNTYEYSERTDF